MARIKYDMGYKQPLLKDCYGDNDYSVNFAISRIKEMQKEESLIKILDAVDMKLIEKYLRTKKLKKICK